MASMLKFIPTRIEIEDEIRRRHLLAEDHKPEKFIAARKIQAWFRGFVTRRHLYNLHEKAITIQRFWRGYRARKLTDERVVRLVHEAWTNYYNSMATRIQAAWRGYWTRKFGVDFVERRRWLASVYDRNELMKENMKLFRLNEVGYVRSVLEQESMLWVLYILFKLHHLLGTKQRPGVLTRLNKARFTFIEQMLTCLKYDLYQPQKAEDCVICQLDAKSSLIFRGTYFERCEKEIREYEMSLKNGDASLLRGERYEEGKSLIISVNDLGRELLEESRLLERQLSGDTIACDSLRECELVQSEFCTRILTSEDACSSVKTTKSLRSIELYEAIDKMDCRLDRLRVRCPIHNACCFKSHVQ